jgi:hypothetical protein
MKLIQKYLNRIILFSLCWLFVACQNNEQVNITYTKENDNISLNVVNNTSKPVYIPKHFFCNRFGDTLFLEGGFRSEDGVKIVAYDFKPVKMDVVKPSKSVSKLTDCNLSTAKIIVVRVYTHSFENYLIETSKKSSQNLFKEFEEKYSYLVTTD